MTQLGLFAVPDEGPTGLRYMDNFIEAAVEQALIGRIAALPLERFQFGAFEGNRRVASFGYRYDYTLQRLAEAEPIPDWLLPVARQAEAWAKLPEASVRQVLCTEYEAGVGIGGGLGSGPGGGDDGQGQRDRGHGQMRAHRQSL